MIKDSQGEKENVGQELQNSHSSVRLQWPGVPCPALSSIPHAQIPSPDCFQGRCVYSRNQYGISTFPSVPPTPLTKRKKDLWLGSAGRDGFSVQGADFFRACSPPPSLFFFFKNGFSSTMEVLKPLVWLVNSCFAPWRKTSSWTEFMRWQCREKDISHLERVGKRQVLLA